jgi:hypothetical protein
MKNKLVLRDNEFTSFHSAYLQYLWQRYFDIEYYDPAKTYDRAGNVFVVNWSNADDDHSNRLKNQGYSVAVDNLWEFPKYRTDCHWIENLDWFWYNESLWWRSMGYHRYRPNKTYSKLALMPIRRQDATRDIIVNRLGHRLDNFIWSYGDQRLPDDVSSSQDDHQRHFNPAWYDQTYFSVVVEAHPSKIRQCQRLTEKSFKPMAHRHPFLLIAQYGALKKLHDLGFETYENLFDESYDDIKDFDQRLAAVLKLIDEFECVAYDSTTLGKLQHNHDHFFDQSLVESKIVSEIINPLLAYAQTR